MVSKQLVLKMHKVEAKIKNERVAAGERIADCQLGQSERIAHIQADVQAT